MQCPPDKAIGYTAVVAICGIVVMAVVGVILGAVTGVGMMGSGALLSAISGGDSGEVTFDPDSLLGALAQLGEALEETAGDVEAARERGDTEAQVNAALEGLGALLGGGRRVEPVGTAQLQSFIPETFLGLP